MPDTPPFGNDVLPALQGLLKYLKSYIHVASDPAASPLELLLALSRIYKDFKSYFKASLLLWLSYRVYYTSPFSFSISWPIYFIPCSLAIMGYFSPTTRFYGPIRFGYLEYSQHFTQAYNVLIDWFVVFAALVIFLPFPWLLFAFGTGVTSFCVVAWVRLVLLYRTSLRAIASDVATETGRARAAKAAACEEASSFSRYEDQVMQAAASARRDAVLSNAVRVTDFFDCTARAWSALGQVRQPAQTAADKADFLVGAAADVLDTDMPDEDEETGESRLDPQAQALQENADEALRMAKDVVSQLEVAQEAIDRSNAANAQDRKARASAETNAMTAIHVARNISNKAAGLLVAKTAAERHSDEVSVLAGQALSAARGGEMARARQIENKAKTSADAADAALVVVRAARAEALEDLLQWLESSRSGVS